MPLPPFIERKGQETHTVRSTLFLKYLNSWKRKHWLLLWYIDITVEFLGSEKKGFLLNRAQRKWLVIALASLHSWSCHLVDSENWCKIRGKNQRERGKINGFEASALHCYLRPWFWLWFWVFILVSLVNGYSGWIIDYVFVVKPRDVK